MTIIDQVVPCTSRAFAKSEHIDENRTYVQIVITFDTLPVFKIRKYSFEDLKPL